MYVLYSIDVPANQNPMYNLCWRITHGKLELTQNCQVRKKQFPGYCLSCNHLRTTALKLLLRGMNNDLKPLTEQ